MKNKKEMINHLIEALPYIKKFQDQVFVFKYGGSIIEHFENKSAFVQDVALLMNLGMKVIIVHGGGKHISRHLEKQGIPTEFHKGYRVTSSEAIDQVEMVLSGHISKDLTLIFNNNGIRAVGLNGKDAGLIQADKKIIDEQMDIGHVGDVKSIDTDFLELILSKGYLPIIAPIGFDSQGNTYNINADDVACEIAKSMKAKKLFMISDVDGVYLDFEDKNSFISRMDVQKARELIETGGIVGGMIPKMLSAIGAIEAGVSSVHIINGMLKHSVLLEVFSNEGIGTMIEN
jgi:acetylglutamate kinase